MLFYVLSAFSIATFGLMSSGESTLPVTICKQDSADYSICLKRAVEEAWPRFIAGLPEFDFPPLDPLFFEYGRTLINSKEVQVELIVSNVTVIGFSKTQFPNVRTHFHDGIFRLDIDTIMPKLFIKGAVKAKGIFSVFKIVSEGYFNVTIEDVTTLWDLTGHVINDTWNVEHFDLSPLLGKFQANFDSLSQESKEFYNIVLNFLNEFWPSIYRQVLPFLKNVWKSWLADVANKFFSNVSFSKIFP